MTSKTVAKKLANLGFEYDEDVTYRDHLGIWHGTIDPVGNVSIGDECRGVVVCGMTRAEMDAEALDEARTLSHYLEPCHDPECDMHGVC